MVVEKPRSTVAVEAECDPPAISALAPECQGDTTEGTVSGSAHGVSGVEYFTGDNAVRQYGCP